MDVTLERIRFRALQHDDVRATRWQYLRLLQARLMEITDEGQRASLQYVIRRLEAELDDETSG